MEKIKLSQTFLKTLMPGECNKYADTENRGLQVWVGKRKISWYFVRKVQGKQKFVNLGQYPEMNLAEARREAASLAGRVANYDSLDAPSARKRAIIRDVFDYYVKNRKSKYRVESIIRNIWSGIMERPVDELSRDEVSQVHRSMKNSPFMANRAVAILRAALSLYIRDGHYDGSNAAARIEFYPEKSRDRFLDANEAPAIIAALELLCNSPYHKPQSEALLVMLYTAQRKSNVLSMRFSQIRDRVWIIPGEEAKGKKNIIVEFTELEWAIIERRRAIAKSDWVFESPKPGQVPHLKEVRKTWLTACRMAGVGDCRIHDLRRTMGSWMLINGVPIAIVSRKLGHSSIKITEKVYAHLLQGQIRDATVGAIEAMSGKKN